MRVVVVVAKSVREGTLILIDKQVCLCTYVNKLQDQLLILAQDLKTQEIRKLLVQPDELILALETDDT